MVDDEAVQRAYQAELEELERQRQAAREARAIERLLSEPSPPIDWSRFTRSVGQMTASEFSAWHEEGCPKLGVRPASAPAQKANGFSAESDAIIAAVGIVLAETRGEMARREKAIRADAASREGVVRGQVEEIRQEVFRTADRLRSELRDNMVGAANRLLTLREEREASQHDLQKQIITLQRELFELRQELAGEKPKVNGLDRTNGRGVHA